MRPIATPTTIFVPTRRFSYLIRLRSISTRQSFSSLTNEWYPFTHRGYATALVPTPLLCEASQETPTEGTARKLGSKLSCPQCSKQFRLQAALDHHMATAHTGADERTRHHQVHRARYGEEASKPAPREGEPPIFGLKFTQFETISVPTAEDMVPFQPWVNKPRRSESTQSQQSQERRVEKSSPAPSLALEFFNPFEEGHVPKLISPPKPGQSFTQKPGTPQGKEDRTQGASTPVASEPSQSPETVPDPILDNSEKTTSEKQQRKKDSGPQMDMFPNADQVESLDPFATPAVNFHGIPSQEAIPPVSQPNPKKGQAQPTTPDDKTNETTIPPPGTPEQDDTELDTSLSSPESPPEPLELPPPRSHTIGAQTLTNPFEPTLFLGVTNPFAPQRSRAGALNPYASELNKKLLNAVQGTPGTSSAASTPGTPFTPFASKGAFPLVPSPESASPAVVTVPLSPISGSCSITKAPSNSFSSTTTPTTPTPTSSSLFSLNHQSVDPNGVSTTTGRIQGSSSSGSSSSSSGSLHMNSLHGSPSGLRSKSPFQHSMHTQLEPPRSPYAPETPVGRVTVIVPSIGPGERGKEEGGGRGKGEEGKDWDEEDSSGKIQEKRNPTTSPERFLCTQCGKMFGSVEGREAHGVRVHGVCEGDSTRTSEMELSTEEIRSGFRGKSSAERNTTGGKEARESNVPAESSNIAVHVTGVNRIVLVGIAHDIILGRVNGLLNLQFNLHVQGGLNGTCVEERIAVRYLCNEGVVAIPISSGKDDEPANPPASNASKRVKTFMTFLSRRATDVRRAHVQNTSSVLSTAEKVAAELQKSLKDGLWVHVVGHLRLNPQLNGTEEYQYFPVVVVHPSTGSITALESTPD